MLSHEKSFNYDYRRHLDTHLKSIAHRRAVPPPPKAPARYESYQNQTRQKTESATKNKEGRGEKGRGDGRRAKKGLELEAREEEEGAENAESCCAVCETPHHSCSRVKRRYFREEPVFLVFHAISLVASASMNSIFGSRLQVIG